MPALKCWRQQMLQMISGHGDGWTFMSNLQVEAQRALAALHL